MAYGSEVQAFARHAQAMGLLSAADVDAVFAALRPSKPTSSRAPGSDGASGLTGAATGDTLLEVRSGRRPCASGTPEAGGASPTASAADPVFAAALPQESGTLLALGSARQSIGALLGGDPNVNLDGGGGGATDPDVSAAKYIEGEVLGRGGMGEVRRALDRDLRRAVAIKTLLSSGDERQRFRFIEEAQVTGQLEHPNIVPVYELGLDAERQQPFLAMKQVRGRSLDTVLKAVRKGEPSGLGAEASTSENSPAVDGERATSSRARRLSKRKTRTRATSDRRGPISERRAIALGVPYEAPAQALSRLLDVFVKVCDAVAYAHSRGVIHRDLKPENIMVGEFGEVLVMDWGLAKIIGREETHEDRLVVTARSQGAAGTEVLRTRDGAIAGTPMYMPPEQARGEIARLDQRSDVYALGALLYEILALTEPFEARSLADLLMRVERGDWQAPSARSRAPWPIARELEAVVMQAMAGEPAARYGSVVELKADVEAYLAGRTLAAAEYTPWQLLKKWATRHKPAVIGSAAVFVALLAGLIGVVYVTQRAKVREAELARDNDRRVIAERQATEAKARAALVSEANLLQERGRAAWSAARDRQAAPNPAAPHEFFQAHLPALLTLARAVQTHPNAPNPWRAEVAEHAGELQRLAEQVNAWSIAAVLAGSVETWGAGDRALTAERQRELTEAQARVAKADRARLDGLLETIARAERSTRTAPGEHGDRPAGALVPGELEERSRRLVAASSPALTGELLRRLADMHTYPLNSLGRQALIAALGRTGDAVATAPDGRTAPEVALAALKQAPRSERMSANAIIAWVWAAARLRAMRITSVGADEPGAWRELDATLDAVAKTSAIIADTVAEARTFLAVARGEPLPTGLGDEALARQIERLGEVTAAVAKSGSRYTAELIALVEDDSKLSDRQIAAVYDQLGLHHDLNPPMAARPKRAAVPVLRAIFDAVPGSYLPNVRPEGVDQATWNRARIKAVATARNLSRLGADASFLSALLRARASSGTNSWFSTRAMLAFALMRISLAHEPTTARAYVTRGVARRELGDLEGAESDFTKAIQLNPNLARTYANRASVRLPLGRAREAIADCTESLRLRRSSEAYNNRGLARYQQRDLAGAIADFTEAIAITPDAGFFNNRAIARKDSGDLLGALADYTEALRLNPMLALAYNNRGNVYDFLKRRTEAIADYTEAIRLRPNSQRAYLNRAVARAATGDLTGARADVSEAIRLDPSDAGGYQVRAQIRTGLNELAGARADYDEAIRRAPRFIEAYTNRGALRARQGDQAGAIADYTTAIGIDPTFAPPYANRGGARLRQGDLAGAIADLDAAIRLDPTLPEPHVNRGHARARQGKREQAIADFTEAIRLKPDFAAAYYGRGNARRGGDDLKGALADYSAAIRCDPRMTRAYSNRGRLRFERKNYRGAVEDFSRVVRLQPRFGHCFYWRGKANAKLGNHKAAVADFSEALRQDADYHKPFYRRGRARDQTGDADGALKDYTESIRRSPKYGYPYYWRGILRTKRRDFAGALADLSEAIRLVPKYNHPWYRRASAYHDRGDLARALADLNKSIERRPDYAYAYYRRGRVYVDLHELDAAIADFTTTLKLKPKYANAFYRRGDARQRAGNHAEALADFERAIGVASRHWEAWRGKALALSTLGRIAEARAAFATALEHAPAEAREAIEKLRRETLGE